MLFLSDRMTSASGSIGGTVFSHNRFGLYTRARRKPVNPNTTAQQLTRSALSDAAVAWSALTSMQRAAWEAYAAATPTTNRLGQTVHLTGSQQFVAHYSFAVGLGEPGPGDAPGSSGFTSIGAPAVVIDDSANTAVISGLTAGLTACALYLGDSISAGRSFFRGPYQFRQSAAPVDDVATLNAITGRNGAPIVAGERIPWRVRGLDANGYMTTEASGIAVVVA